VGAPVRSAYEVRWNFSNGNVQAGTTVSAPKVKPADFKGNGGVDWPDIEIPAKNWPRAGLLGGYSVGGTKFDGGVDFDDFGHLAPQPPERRE
jgi:hypothetical protein